MIGNIYLFKEGYRAGDKTFYVYDPSGLPIQNATIGVYQNVANNNAPALNGISYSDRLSPSGGLYSNMTATTDANGMATISGSQLVLGGRYLVKVVPMMFNGQYLYRSVSGDDFWEYSVNPPMVLGMSSLASEGALFATSASNQVPGTITASGVLTVTFNQPVILTTTGFNAAGLASDNTSTNFDIQAVLSADGLTMTLTPNSAITGTTADGAGSVVTFTSLAAGNQPFIIKATQVNSGLTLNEGGSELQNITTGSAVSNVVRQLSN